MKIPGLISVELCQCMSSKGLVQQFQAKLHSFQKINYVLYAVTRYFGGMLAT